MQKIVPLKFTSGGVEQNIKGICAVHGIRFRDFERMINEDLVLVDPGGMDLAIDIGRDRVAENPSRRLEGLLMAALNGYTFAMKCQGTGHALKLQLPSEPDPLEEFLTEFKAQIKRERWLRELN